MATDIKPKTAEGYDPIITRACESALLTLLGAFTTLGDTVRLVGGLAPRYLTPENAPGVPAHAGTSDVDIVLDLAVIAEGEGYADLATQLNAGGFRRHINERGNTVAWRWEITIQGIPIMVEFLRDAQGRKPSTTIPIDGENVSALAIKHAGIAHDWFIDHKVTGELGDGAIVTRTIHVADVPAFVILKALSLQSRYENKDAADLIHVLRYAGSVEEIAQMFVQKLLSGAHPEAMKDGLEALADGFRHPERRELSYKVQGPFRYAQFHYGSGESEAKMEAQRFAAGLVGKLLDEIKAQERAARKAAARGSLKTPG